MSALRNRTPAMTIAHVADVYRRYPGEPVTFYTRVEMHEPLPDLSLRVTLPAGIEPEGASVVDGPEALVSGDGPRLETEPAIGATHVTWALPADAAPLRCEVQVKGRIVRTVRERALTSRAMAICDGQQRAVGETVAVVVEGQARYMAHLPAIYHDNDLMSRFLMLFESFWDPIETQIDHLPYYFDPRLTSPEFLRWMASWLDLTLDERWPEDKQRALVCSAVSLYRMRGTRRGLEALLTLYTGEKPRIIEHRAKNFRLGADALLGPGIALGRDNQPHTFTVILRLPPVAGADELDELDEDEVARREAERRRVIESIIEAEKPAYTDYYLRLETLPG